MRVLRTVSRALLLVPLATAQLAAQGSLFRAIQAGQTRSLDYPMSWVIRGYIATTLETMAETCKSTLVKTPEAYIPWAEMLRIWFSSKSTSDGARLALAGEILRLNAWVEHNTPEADANAYLERASCSRAAQNAWATSALAALKDPVVGASITNAAKSACDTFSTELSDCECFAKHFDLEATPAERRVFVGAVDTLTGIRAALSNPSFAVRIASRCTSRPTFPRARLTANSLRRDRTDRAASFVFNLFSERKPMTEAIRASGNQAMQFFNLWPSGRPGNEVQLHACDYGPDPRRHPPYQDNDSSSVYFLYPDKAPSQAEIAQKLEGNMFLPEILHLGRARRVDCPPTLSEARALKAAASDMEESGTVEPTPTVSRPGDASSRSRSAPTPVRRGADPAAGSPTPRPPVPNETLQERNQREKCNVTERTLPGLRKAVLDGRYSALALAKVEADYRRNCSTR